MELFFRRQGFTAREANRGSSLGKIRKECYTLVEDETLTIPVVASNLFKVAKDASFELLDVGKTCIFHDHAGFLAADASSTEHDDFFVFVG